MGRPTRWERGSEWFDFFQELKGVEQKDLPVTCPTKKVAVKLRLDFYAARELLLKNNAAYYEADFDYLDLVTVLVRENVVIFSHRERNQTAQLLRKAIDDSKGGNK